MRTGSKLGWMTPLLGDAFFTSAINPGRPQPYHSDVVFIGDMETCSRSCIEQSLFEIPWRWHLCDHIRERLHRSYAPHIFNFLIFVPEITSHSFSHDALSRNTRRSLPECFAVYKLDRNFRLRTSTAHTCTILSAKHLISQIQKSNC